MKIPKSVKKVVKIITIVVCIVIGVMLALNVMNTRVFSEKRATKNADMFIYKNKIEVKRLTCAGDGIDPKYKIRDGYGSCALVTNADEKIMLQCPTDFLANLFGAKNCKEVFLTLNISSGNSSDINQK